MENPSGSTQRLNVRVLAKEVYSIWFSERPTQLAAALAFFGLFSFAPVIYIALTIAGIFIDEAETFERFLSRIEATLGTSVAQNIYQMVLSVSESQPATGNTLLVSLISFFVLLLTASGVFLQLQYALNTIWKVSLVEKNVWWLTVRHRLFSFLMVISLGLLLVVGSVASVITSWFSSFNIISNFLPALTFFGFIAFASVTFAVMYKLLPAVKIAWGDVWIGAITAATIIAIVGSVLIFFMGNTNISSALEAAGSFVILLYGFYYFAQTFLLGAVISRVYAHRYGSMRSMSGLPKQAWAQEDAENAEEGKNPFEG